MASESVAKVPKTSDEGQVGTCVPFPRGKKRGAKVRRGPCAQIIPFPQPLSGDELRGRWAYLRDNHKHWHHETTDGTYTDPKDWDTAVRIHGEMGARMEGREFNEATMRRDIARFVEAIAKRVALKDTLSALGVNWGEVRTAEQALFVLSDRLGSGPGAA